MKIFFVNEIHQQATGSDNDIINNNLGVNFLTILLKLRWCEQIIFCLLMSHSELFTGQSRWQHPKNFFSFNFLEFFTNSHRTSTIVSRRENYLVTQYPTPSNISPLCTLLWWIREVKFQSHFFCKSFVWGFHMDNNMD